VANKLHDIHGSEVNTHQTQIDVSLSDVAHMVAYGNGSLKFFDIHKWSYLKARVSKLVFADDVKIYVWIPMLGFTAVFSVY